VTATRARVLRRLGAITGVVALAGLTTAPVFAADSGSGSVKVVNTETIQVYMSAAGDIQSKRVYEQLALSGHGSVDLKNPVSTDGLRNIDGFGGFDVKDGEQIVKTTVDGTKHYRSVSNFTGTLPVSVTTEYTLDGKKVSPGDVVGKSGKLAVKFVVTNKTSIKQEVTVADGSGGTVTKTVDVPVPMVGSLTTTAPSNFTNVEPGGASTAGDGAGGTTMSYTMTLFPPLGSDSATLGYTADITDGVVPRVDVALLPVDPLSSPTFKSAGESYQGGADTGAQLVTGAGTIDGNLLKLRDGAADLLAGLIKLSDGSTQLNDGLANDAAPGAKKLAAGTGDALDGSQKLFDGAKQLKGGLSTATGGGTQLDSGAKDLLAGQKALAGGLTQLYAGIQALPASVQAQLATDPQYQALLGALGQVVAGIGTLADQPQANPADNTLLGGLNGLKYGMRYPGTVDCVNHPLTQCGIIDGVSMVKAGIDAQITGSAGLGAALTAARTSAGCVGDPVCSGNLDAIIPALVALPDALQQASAALGLAVAGGDGQLIPGINLMRAHVSTGANPATCVSNPSGCGAREALLAVQGGIPLLVQGITSSIRDTLLANIGTGAAGCDPTKTLQCGANALSAGTQQLADGVSQLVAGLGQLSTGGSQLAGGAGDLADGLGQIDDGANDLADGLGDAADGSGQIADGLKTASGSTPQLVDGAKRLSTEGMGQLIQAGKDTAVNYGELYAVIKAGSERAQTSSMAYGAPAGAEGLTAYAFTLKGEDGEGTRNLTRGVGALALLGLGAGVCVMRRRLA
jgi:putative membrane protein